MKLEKEGTFRAHIVGWKTVESKTGWMGIIIDCMCVAEYDRDTKTWIDIPVPCSTEGIVTMISTDGSLDYRNREEFEYASGWDGTLDQLYCESPRWEPKVVEVAVAQSKKGFKGEYPFQVQRFIRIVQAGEAAPSISPTKIDRLKARLEAAKSVKPNPKDWVEPVVASDGGEVPF